MVVERHRRVRLIVLVEMLELLSQKDHRSVVEADLNRRHYEEVYVS